MKEIEFIREKLAATCKVSTSLISDLKLEVGAFDDDFILDQLTVQLSGYIYSNMAEERELVYYCERPSFLDWLLRRRKEAVFTLKVKDLMIDPPKLKESKRIYIIEEQHENTSN